MSHNCAEILDKASVMLYPQIQKNLWQIIKHHAREKEENQL